MRFLTTFSTLLLTALLSFQACAAPAYPEKPVTLIVPYPPGGTTDVLARLIAARLHQNLGQTFIVENRPGASGQIGTRAVARAKPDGYTLLMGTISHIINAALYKDLPYRAVEDFAPVSIVADTPNVLIAAKDAPFSTFDEFLAYAKAHPAELSFGSTSLGGSPHMSGELLKSQAQISMLHIPYQGGGPMMSDVIGGQIPLGFDNLPSSAPQINAGHVRALAVTTKTRWPGFPDIPSISELGLPEYEVASWFGIFAPAHTPDAIVQTLQQAIASILEQEDMQTQLLHLGARPVGNSPADFQQLVVREFKKWTELVEHNHLEQR